MTELQFAIYEACYKGDIDEATKESMLHCYTEGSITERPLKEFKDKILSIKKEKPDQFTEDKEVKKFIDKNYDTIMKAANLLEEEPEKMRATDTKQVIALTIELIAMVIGCCTAWSPVGFAVTVISYLIFMIHSFVLMIIIMLRNNDDVKVSDDLSKIRTALKKIDKKKLKTEDRRKIEKMITAIDDAETEISARVKVSKESVDEYNQMKFAIYEREYAGEISLEKRNSLIDKLDEVYGVQ